MKKYTKNQLVRAMFRYNNDVAENPESYTEADPSMDCAKDQVDKLLSFVE